MAREGDSGVDTKTNDTRLSSRHRLVARILFGLKRLLTLSRFITAPLYWWYQRRLEAEVRKNNLVPAHLGVILDGNRRYARTRGYAAELGHSLGAEKAQKLIEWCVSLGVPYATLWVFSTDNQSRDEDEVVHLYKLFADHARSMAVDPRIHERRVRVRTIGDLSQLPEDVRQSFKNLEDITKDYDGLQLFVALCYGGREEITSAVRKALLTKAEAGQTLQQVADTLSVEDISEHMYAAACPDPDFIIRTSGEIRLSGFLLWQSVYSEYYFCDVYWPEFRRLDFLRALRAYQKRQRRFGR